MTEPTDDEIVFFARAEGPVAWAATSEDGVVEALGINQSRRFDTPLYLAPQSVVREPLTRQQLCEAFYSETACTLGGDVDFAEKVCRVVEKAHGIKGGQHGTE